MLGSSRLVAFVSTTDARRARDFYQNTLGLSFVADDGSALVMDAGGVMVRVARVKALTPAPYTTLGWGVTDIVSVVEGLRSRGVVFERFAGLKQDEAGVWLSPSGARVAWFKDPDGNLLSVTQFP